MSSTECDDGLGDGEEGEVQSGKEYWENGEEEEEEVEGKGGDAAGTGVEEVAGREKEGKRGYERWEREHTAAEEEEEEDEEEIGG